MPAHASLPDTATPQPPGPPPSTPRPHLRLLPPPTWTDPQPAPGAAIPGQQLLALEFLMPNGLPAVPAGQTADTPASRPRHAPEDSHR